MSNRIQTQGLIFDMDNTLLKSSIDFHAMKMAIFELLIENGIVAGDLPIERHTTATIIEHARQQQLEPGLERRVWELAAAFELAGMEGAGLEPGVRDFLDSVHGRFTLAVVTNNSFAAAERALYETGIAGYFDLLVGREQMDALKPSASGFRYVLDRYRDIPGSQWLSVGDSWIDGKGSNEAGIPFVSYQTELHVMVDRGVKAIGKIGQISELLAYARRE